MATLKKYIYIHDMRDVCNCVLSECDDGDLFKVAELKSLVEKLTASNSAIMQCLGVKCVSFGDINGVCLKCCRGYHDMAQHK